MPLPTPDKGEQKDHFVSRCMGSEVTNKDFDLNIFTMLSMI